MVRYGNHGVVQVIAFWPFYFFKILKMYVPLIISQYSIIWGILKRFY